MYRFLIFVLSLFPLAANALTVYSYRHYESDQRLFELFTEKTGISVKVVKAKARYAFGAFESRGHGFQCRCADHFRRIAFSGG